MVKFSRGSIATFLSFLVAFVILSLITPNIALAKDTVFRGGKLRVTISDDFRRGRHKIEHFLDLGGKRYALRFPRGKQPKDLRGEVRVTVRGRKLNSKTIEVSSSPGSFQAAESVSSEDAYVGGVRHAILLKIQSSTAVSSASVSQLSAVMSLVSNRYRESSYGIFDMKNDRDGNGVSDIFTVSLNESTAGTTDTFALCNRAVSGARTQHSIEPTAWNHIVCILPPDMNYTYFGTAYVPGSMSVISGKYAHSYHDGYVHELGHNLGLGHSNSPTAEYGDVSCVMGGPANNRTKDFNGPKKMELSWVPATSASSGRYLLNAIEIQPSARVSNDTLLKLRDPITNENVYVSYRVAAGTVTTGQAGQLMTNVYTFPGGTAKSIQLASLGDGQSFSRNGISITQVSHDSVSATVDIGTICTRRPPTVSLSPSRLVGSSPIGSFTVSVTNNDVGCSDSATFALGASGSGASVSLGSASMSLAQGQSGATTLGVSASSVGSFGLSVAASEASHGSASAAGTFVFDNVAPNAITTLRAAVKQTQTSLSWSAPSDAGSKVVSYRVFSGSSQIGTTSTPSFSLRSPKGTVTYTVVAVDEAGNVSAPSNAVTVTSGSSKPRR